MVFSEDRGIRDRLIDALLYLVVVGGLTTALGLGASAAFAQSVQTYIPPQAIQYFPVIKQEVNTYLPRFEEPAYFGALFEHESCIHLKHPKCYNASSELRSAREQGVGFGQLTRTWKADGTPRFDTLQDLRNQYQSALKELTWETIKQRPDLQIRSTVLLSRNNYLRFADVKDPVVLMKFMDGAYNAGYGTINKRRVTCGLQKGCDPMQWEGHVGGLCLTGTKVLYANRTACDIVNHHVYDVTVTRLPKYIKAFRTLPQTRTPAP